MALESFSGKPESYSRGLDVLLSFFLHRVEKTHLNQTFVSAPACTVALINCCDFSLSNLCLVTLANLSLVLSRTEIIG